MEIRIKNKNKNKIKESRGPELEQKWGILKYLSAEISFEKSTIILDRMTRVSDALGQKLRYDIYILVGRGNPTLLGSMETYILTGKEYDTK